MTDILKAEWNDFPKVLPKKEDDYLVTIKVSDTYSYVTIRRWSEFYDEKGHRRTTWNFYDQEWGYMAQNGVTGWLPIPEPYKKDISNEKAKL